MSPTVRLCASLVVGHWPVCLAEHFGVSSVSRECPQQSPSLSVVHCLGDDRRMANPKFPIGTPQTLGGFQTPDGRQASGLCRIGTTIELELAEALLERSHVPIPGVAVFKGVANPIEADLVVHGNIASTPKKLTFLGTHKVARRVSVVNLVPGDAGGKSEPEYHRYRAAWCIAGVHLPSQDATFTAVRARFNQLELWHVTNGVEVNRNPERPEVNIKLSMLESVTAPFTQFDEDARLEVLNAQKLRRPTPWGAGFDTTNWLQLDGLSGWTLDQAVERFVRPVQSLLTILSGEQCEVLEFEVKVDDRWCAVYGGLVKPDAARPDPAPQMLLERQDLGLEAIAEWCHLCTDLAPAPHVIATAVGIGFGAVETQALVLATTAEGLDRALHPGSRRFTEQEVADSIGVLEASDIPSNVRGSLTGALRVYLYQDTYATRMKRLAEDVAEVAPTCVGKPQKWRDAMSQLRNGLAHSLGSGSAPSSADSATARAQSTSLQWALLIRLLILTGVSGEALSKALDQSSRYQQAQRLWAGRFGGAAPAN